MLVEGTHEVNYINNFKYCHFQLCIFSHYMFLSTKIEAHLYLILKFMIKIHVLTTIYICLLQILTFMQKGVLYSGSKIYNLIPLNIKMLSKDAKQFKSTLGWIL
jgi:hypothetical protein